MGIHNIHKVIPFNEFAPNFVAKIGSNSNFSLSETILLFKKKKKVTNQL